MLEHRWDSLVVASSPPNVVTLSIQYPQLAEIKQLINALNEFEFNSLLRAVLGTLVVPAVHSEALERLVVR